MRISKKASNRITCNGIGSLWFPGNNFRNKVHARIFSLGTIFIRIISGGT
jgi:hypothetical protein